MSNKYRQFFSNVSYSLLAQLVSLLVSAFLIVGIPKFLDLETYSYWQLYLLYASYVGVLHFGLIDGIYLRYGGCEYSALNKPKLRSQFWIILMTQILFAGIIFLVANIVVEDPSRKFIFSALSFYMVFLTLNGFFLFILQTTNRIKDYARILVIDRLCFFIGSVLVLLFGLRNFKYIILADVLAKFIGFIIGSFYCKDLIFGITTNWISSIKEASANISAGIKIIVSNVSGVLIIGIVRWLIERNWDLITFGKISLTISISNIMLVFIAAISIVVFPMLKRMPERRLPEIYIMIRSILMLCLTGFLLFFFPLKYLMGNWLPMYADKLIYLALLFPVCLFESKFSLLANTYFKALRMEGTLLKINLFSVALCIVINILLIKVFNSLDLVVLSILVIFAVRSIVAEIILTRILKVRVCKDIIFECLITLCFVISGWYFPLAQGAILYLGAYIVYLLFTLKDHLKAIHQLVGYLKQSKT